VTYALTRRGYIVVPASNAQTALRICTEREGPIHLAVLDIMMPGMSGPELFGCLQEYYPDIPVLFMSGFTAEHIKVHAPPLGKGAHFIAKPFLPKDLVQRVNAILGNEEVCTLRDEPELTYA